MGFKISDIDSYSISYYSAFSNAAYIHCYHSGKRVGMLIFVKDGEPVPQNRLTKSSDSNIDELNIHFPISSFTDIVNILRSEESIRLDLNTEDWSGVLVTGTKPIEKKTQ
jgi:hypothetical protein